MPCLHRAAYLLFFGMSERNHGARLLISSDMFTIKRCAAVLIVSGLKSAAKELSYITLTNSTDARELFSLRRWQSEQSRGNPPQDGYRQPPLLSCISMESSVNPQCIDGALIRWDKPHLRQPGWLTSISFYPGGFISLLLQRATRQANQ